MSKRGIVHVVGAGPGATSAAAAKRTKTVMAARPAVLLLALLPVCAAAAEPTAERQHQLIYRLRQDCGSCHGMTLKGGLGPALLPARMRQRDEAHLAEVIRDGIPGTPMPPWGFEISETEARWLARQLRQGVDDAR